MLRPATTIWTPLAESTADHDGASVVVIGGNFYLFGSTDVREQPLAPPRQPRSRPRSPFAKGPQPSAGRAPTAGQRLTFDGLVDLIERDYKLKNHRSLPRAQTGIAHLRAFFGGMVVEDITEARFPEYQERRASEGASGATVRYELTLLRRMFSLAVRQRRLRMAPVFDLPTIKNARKGFLTAANLAELLPHLPEEIQPVITFAFYTGWRIPSDVFPLRWEQVDLAAGEVRLDAMTTKNDEPRVFPFAQFPALDTLLHQQREEAEAIERAGGVVVPWVFHRQGKRIRDCRGACEKALMPAGLAGRLMHDLRRSAVRNLVNAGVPELTAMKLTGHKTRAIFARYNIVSSSETAGAVAKLANYLATQECHKTGTISPVSALAPKTDELSKSR